MDIIVIGAGASGMMAAISAARLNNKVTLIEHTKTVGNKLAITGNGRCNLTNTDMSTDYFYGDRDFINEVLNSFSIEDTLKFFESIGVYTINENGYIYPRSNQAQTVVKALKNALLNYKVKVKTNNDIKSIKKIDDKFIVDVGIELMCDKLIIATGGKSYESTGSDGSINPLIEKLGHKIIEQKPSLVSLICNDDILFKSAAGVRCNVALKLKDKSLRGQLQITNYGISGICVFNISHLIDKETKIVIDFMDEISKDNFFKFCENMKEGTYGLLLNALFNDKLAATFLKKLNLKADDIIDKNILLNIYEELSNYKVVCLKTRKFDVAQVTKGGVKTDEINPKTMESKIVPGLYFCGEIIDVDGYCGGYNLQFAWSSGFIAGNN